MKDSVLTTIYEFDEYRLDARNRLLWLGEKQISLTLKEFDVLLYLVENAGRVVEKNTLLEAVWENTFVEEATLARNVSWLRKKLAASGAADNFIQTLPRRGYRFAAPVKAIPSAAAFIEEKIVTEIIIEESISLDEPFAAPAAFANNSPDGIERLTASISERADALKILPAAPPARFSKSLKRLFGGLLAAVIIAAAAFYFLRNDAPIVVVLKSSIPFSGLPGRENMPSFSPDGSQIAFAWNGGEGENFDIYAKQIGAGEPRRLTVAPADEVNPVFTPDNSQIAFVRRLGDRSEVFRIPSLGGAERKIADLQSDISELSFSPDGRFLAASDLDEASGREAIFLIDVGSGAKRRLTAPPELTKDRYAKFSPDGKKIAFLRRFNNSYDELLLVSGDETTQLTFEKSDMHGLSWRADNQTIVFARRESALVSNLWQISATGGAAQIIVSNGKSATNPAISADGRRLAYVEESFETDIWKFEKNLPARRLIESVLDDHSPDFSPDGARAAFVSYRTGSAEVWIADADGKNQRQITGGDSFEPAANPPEKTSFGTSAGSPRFSPDGQQIIYDAPVGGNPEIFTIAADGSGAPRRLTFGTGRSFLPSWSADGNWIYFCSDRGASSNIWRMSPAGGSAVQITKNGGFESFPAPDNQTIFYTKGGDAAGVWQISADGGGEDHAVPELDGASVGRYLTMNKTGIYFTAQDSGGFYSIKFYNFSDKKISEVLKTDKTPIWTYSGMSVSPDGKIILYSSYTRSQTSITLADF